MASSFGVRRNYRNEIYLFSFHSNFLINCFTHTWLTWLTSLFFPTPLSAKHFKFNKRLHLKALQNLVNWNVRWNKCQNKWWLWGDNKSINISTNIFFCIHQVLTAAYLEKNFFPLLSLENVLDDLVFFFLTPDRESVN